MAIAGLREGNALIPYSESTKKTKFISITDTSYLVATGTNVTASTEVIQGAEIQA